MNNYNRKITSLMKVCIFCGAHSFKENELLKKILELQNVEVIECLESISGVSSFISANFKMFFRHLKLSYDVMIVPWWGIFTFPLAKIICRKPIIYWSNLSIYHTIIEDRKKLKPNSFLARFVHFAEGYACKHSQMVITESQAQRDFLIQEYNLENQQFRITVNGVDETNFLPLPFKEKEKFFNVLFFGGFVPAHGTFTIIESAKILSSHEDIVFNFYGDGPLRDDTERLAGKYKLKNVKFFDQVPQNKLLSVIKESDICVGIFGKSQKAANVIPNKVLQILASQKPLLTRDSKAMQEINLKSGENCLLVPSDDPKKLTDAILILKNDPKIREKIAVNGYQLYRKNLSMDETGKRFVKFIQEVQT